MPGSSYIKENFSRVCYVANWQQPTRGEWVKFQNVKITCHIECLTYLIIFSLLMAVSSYECGSHFILQPMRTIRPKEMEKYEHV